MRTWIRNCLSIVAVAGAVAPATAAEMSLGAFEYMNSCAQCHGADGKGDGPVSAYLATLPPDLTALSLTNGGVFPATKVYAVIDGTADVALHGGRDMPMWGDRYVARMLSDPGETASVAMAERYSRTRILALVEYLSGIQQD